MVESLPPPLRGLERDLELLLRALLTDEIVESARTQGLLDVLVALTDGRCEELARHAAVLSA